MDVLKRNNVTVTGKGQTPMLFAHGYGCDQNMWRYITPAFEADYQIILFDHMGFGQSDVSGYSPKKYGSLHAYADDILEICQALNLQDVIFVGHSVSAMIGVLAAIQAPKIVSETGAHRALAALYKRAGLHGRFRPERYHDMLDSLDSNYLGWAAAMAPVIMGNAATARTGRRTGD